MPLFLLLSCLSACAFHHYLRMPSANSVTVELPFPFPLHPPNLLHHDCNTHRSKKKRVEEKRGSGAPRERVKKNEKELANFYKFQIREEKQKKLFDLRKRFDEDKEKVALMKSGRKFKPF